MPLFPSFDPLFCQEDNLHIQTDHHSPPLTATTNAHHHLLLAAASSAAPDELWSEILHSLAAKAPDATAGVHDGGSYLPSARKEAADWILSAAGRHGFSALTALLAVNYLDRCFLPSTAGAGGGSGVVLRLQEDKPWMARLAAVACLSLAAKVEETLVPLPIDLQFLPPAAADAPATSPESPYVFESKTIRRMELLVLSTLGWRMNPVTPLSFVHHLGLRFFFDGGGGAGAAADRTAELVRRCEVALIAAVADSRWVRYPASVWASAALLYANEQTDNSAVFLTDLGTLKVRQDIALLNAPMEKVQECHRIMLDSMVICKGSNCRKRKQSSSSVYGHYYLPSSPCGVIGSCFSYESSSSSGDSCTMWPASMSLSSPEIQPSKLACFENNKSLQ